MALDRCSFGIAQLNTCVGDVAGNREKICEVVRQARDVGVTLLLTPELSLSGYPPQDFVLRKDFLDYIENALNALAVDLATLAPHMAVVVGYPEVVKEINKPHGAPVAYNTAAVLFQGQVIARHRKQVLPNYGVFDEHRYFIPGNSATVFEFHGQKLGLLICEDVWTSSAVDACCNAEADVLLVVNASPWHRGKKTERLAVLKQVAHRTQRPLIYCNQVGAQDALIFDGSSCVISRYGEVRQQLPSFSPAFALVEMVNRQPIWAHNPLAFENLTEHADSVLNDLYQALCLGVRDYVHKNGFSRVLLGLSGGIDSALTLAIAVDALGKDAVRAVMLPSIYTSSISLEDAEAMVKKIDVRYDIIPIRTIVDEMTAVLQPLFDGKAPDLTEENIQARTRGLLLMALSNKHGELLLTTGNKSEMAVGYATLYGDMCGGLAVLMDVTKQWVYALARYRNRLGHVIPDRILQRPPSAELRPDQTDQDSLPPYEVLDAIIEAYVEQGLGLNELLAKGFNAEIVQRIIRLIHLSEYKRQQSAQGLKVSPCAFGYDWRFPLTQKWLKQQF